MANPLQVDVTPQARSALKDICAARKMTQTGLLSAMIEWLTSLDKTSLTLVIGQFEDADILALCEALLRRANEPVAADLLATELMRRREIAPQRQARRVAK